VTGNVTIDLGAASTDAVLTMDGSSDTPGTLTYESDNALFILNKDVAFNSGNITIDALAASTDAVITMDGSSNSPGTITYRSDGAPSFVMSEFLRVESGVNITNNLLVNGGDIGVNADTDLIQLAVGGVTINGTGVITGNVRIGDTTAPTYELEVAGTAQVDDNITVGTASPSAGFSGAGDIYATSGIKAMEGLYSEAVAYGAGLEVSDNSLSVKYTNVVTGTATLTAATQVIYDPEGDFVTDGVVVGDYLKVVTATAGGSPAQYIGATGEIIAVTDATHLVVSFGSAGGDTIIDATAMSFVIYPSPNFYVSDNGDIHAKVGVNENASFKVSTELSNNAHAVHFVTKAGVNGNAALEIEYDVNGHSDCSAIEVGYDATGFDEVDTVGTVLDVIIDNAGATAGDMHVMDVALSDTTNTDLEVEAVATHEGVDVIAQYLGDAAALDTAWSYNGSTFTDRTTAFNTAGTNVEIFSGDNDYILLGSTAKWDEINVLNATNSSRNIRAVFEYIEDDGSWVVFAPGDDTNGFRRNGTIRFDSDTLTTWGQRTVNEVTGETGAVDYYWIRITRTRNNIPTPPIESTIKVTTIGAKLGWDSTGRLAIKTYSQSGEPDTTDLPASKFCFWIDTDNSKLYLCYNQSGTVKTVELT